MNDFFDKLDFQSSLLLKSLPLAAQQQVLAVCEPMSFAKGDKLFYEDGVPTGIFLLESGKAKKYKSVLANQQQIFYVYVSGDLFGYHALLSQERYQDSCEALDDLTAQFISKENFFMLLENIPDLKQAVIRNISHEFGVLANIIGILAQKSQNIRLAVFLLVLDNRFSQLDSHYEGLDISRQDLANMVGTTRESLGRSLKEMKDSGLISINKRLILLDNKAGLFEMAKG